MERFSNDADLAAALRAVRPTPRPDFAAELDDRAAAGFPRRAPEGSAVDRLLARARALRARQVLIPVGATALVAVVLATAVVAINDSSNSHLSVALDNDGGTANHNGNGGFITGTEGIGETTTPSFGAGPVKPFSHQMERSFGAEEELLSKQAGGDVSLSAASAGSAGIQYEDSGLSSAAALRSFANAAHRDVERSAEIVLGADPDQVDETAAEVFDAVHANNGIVLRSSIQNGSAAGAGAEFELLIPSGKLGDALAAFSEIGAVRSRHEATDDITAPTVTASERLRDSRARIDGLLAQLAETTTENEREAVEAELATERRHAASLRAQLANLDRRASLSRVSVRIESGAGSASSREDSSWGIGDALGDAGRILGVAAAVTVVGLAVLGPAALIALLAWLAHRAWLRRGRERALS